VSLLAPSVAAITTCFEILTPLITLVPSINFTVALETAAMLNLKISVHNDVDQCTMDRLMIQLKNNYACGRYRGYDECPLDDCHWVCSRNN